VQVLSCQIAEGQSELRPIDGLKPVPILLKWLA
jgi:hypothetical protein